MKAIDPKIGVSQRAKTCGFCGESLGMVVVGGGNPRKKIWVVSETRILVEIQGKYTNRGLKWEGSFLKPLNILIHIRMTLNHHLDIFKSATLPMSLYCILKFWGETQGKHPQGFHRERRRKYPHRKFPFISPELPLGNHEEISTGMFPWNYPINPRGNLGDVDGSSAAMFPQNTKWKQYGNKVSQRVFNGRRYVISGLA